jgi:uncharacterized membrane protein
MTRQELKRKETQVSAPNGDGKQLEQTFTIDDNWLPSPEDLIAYKQIDPNILQFLLDVAKKEQNHRHAIEKKKINIISREGRREFRINLWGMFFAFLILLVGFCFSAYLLYLGSNVIGTIFGGVSLISAAALFTSKGDSNKKK